MTATAEITVPTGPELLQLVEQAAAACGVDLAAHRGEEQRLSPITGTPLVPLAHATVADANEAVERAHRAFLTLRDVPAPQRGNLISIFGRLLREHKDDLATLVSIEAGKITSEALGEVQEMIDICDFAVGLSRQLYGRTMPSERPGHRLMETWHPLGVVGVISAFNFPVAVWSWNTAVAIVCGDPVVWKPSDQTPLSALAANALMQKAIAEAGMDPDISQVLLGGPDIGGALVDHRKVALLSATGSTRMGREVGPRVAARFGRSLLELGGNNAAIVAPSADLDLATRGVVFAAAGTAGQRCTTMRRAIVHRSIADELVGRLVDVYGKLPIGDPMRDGTLVGPLAGAPAFEGFTQAIADAQAAGGEVVVGGSRVIVEGFDDAYYVQPTIIRMPAQTDVVERETFAPILYILEYDSLDEAIDLNNGVPQGLSSSIFTQDQAEAERFMAASGSDCGIVNVNIGTSGAEIGGAFGGEKETGGGRESGSDAWRTYMRRATNTINYSGELPLAQGVNFDV